MIKRHIQNLLNDYLKLFPAVWLGGARQTGKSTLVMALPDYHYVTLDDITLYMAAQDSPQAFIQSLPKPVIIDEIQRVPELLLAIKQDIDLNRHKGRYLLTGSANLLGMKNVQDSQAGRLGVLELTPFSLRELNSHPQNLLDDLFDGTITQQTPRLNKPMIEQMLSGGYPEMQTLNEARLKKLWMGAYITTYIERDAFNLAEIRKKDAFYRLYHILASRSANLLNKASLARDIGISAALLDDYLALLQTTYQIELVSAYWDNLTKRHVKMPKLFFMDTGVLCNILQVNLDSFWQSTYRGLIAENFVFSELYRAKQTTLEPTELHHLRTSDQKEIDLIIQRGQQTIGIEVKASSQIDASAFKHLKPFAEGLGERFKGGYVFYLGEHAVQFGDDLWALPMNYLG
jgi:uncharacterized protein